MVSAACLVGRQTILVCLFPEKSEMGSQEKNRDKWMENATGRFLVQIHRSHFVSKIVCSVPKIAMEEIFFNIYFTSDVHANTIISRRACVIIWCPECWN